MPSSGSLSQSPMCPVILLSLLDEFLVRYRVDVGPIESRGLYDRAAVNPPRFDNPLASMPMADVAKIFQVAAELSQDPLFGMNYGEYFALRGTGVIGQLQMAAPTIGAMLKASSEFASLGYPSLQIQYKQDVHGSRIVGYLPAELGIAPDHLGYMLMAIMVARIRRTAGAGWTPQLSEFAHGPPADLQPVRRLFGASLIFNARAYALSIDAATLAIEVPNVPRGSYDLARQFGELLRRQMSEDETSAGRTARAIQLRLAGDQPVTLELIADDLGCPSRTLQSWLTQDATTFEAILFDVRKALAVGYLRDSDRSMTDISSLLGFSEASALTRWCTTNFQATPTKLRHALKAGTSVPGLTDTPAGESASRQAEP